MKTVTFVQCIWPLILPLSISSECRALSFGPLNFLIATFLDAQLVTILGNANRAENCAEWTDWGPCIWLRGDNNARWGRSFFDQLLPGRTGCRSHMFFKLLRERWGQAFENVVDYLREMTLSSAQCGQCSYQQSCGRRCHRRVSANSVVNPLFVAERRCEGVDQSVSCVSRPTAAGDCKLWPNRAIALPNVSDWMVAMIHSVQFLNCVPQTTANGVRLCRCCCAPFIARPEAPFHCEMPKEEAAKDDDAKHSIPIASPTEANASSDYAIPSQNAFFAP
uniref:Secreted protein n=1 Tax=Globodera rostochiensis TaxID=31243 RepID=A0A914GXY4_GLORO